MYRIGDTVRVKNGSDTHPYHNWSVGTEAVVQSVTENNLYLRISPPRRGAMTTQTLYEHDVEFVRRSKYEEGDMVTVIGHSLSHDIPIGTIVKIEGIHCSGNDTVIHVIVEATSHQQGVLPESLTPIEFSNVYTEGLSASPTTFETLSIESLTARFTQLAEQLHGMGTNYGSNRFIPVDTHFTTSAHIEPVRYAIAVPNDVVTVHSITDRPKCEDENLFTEFTSWLHPFIGGARDASMGLVIDACTVITFLGKTDQDDLFSIRYEDTGNIVIAKGKLNNGYAKYRA